MFLRFIPLSVVMSIVLAAPPAFATFPGENGRIAYVGSTSGRQIFLTDSGQLTFPPPLVADFTPAFSPDGKQVAFLRQTPVTGGYFYQLMVVGTDGAGPRQVADSRAFAPNGVVPFNSISYPAWLPDGQRISLVIRGLGDKDGIWTVGGSEGTVQTVQGNTSSVNWSSADEMVYPCLTGLCVYNSVTKDVRQLPIDLPGQSILGLGEPKWTPDGEKIVFFLNYIDGKVNRFDIFSVNADGTGLTKLSDSGPDLCPDDPVFGAPSFLYQSPTPSPDGQSIVAIKWRNARLAGPGCRSTPQEKWLSILDLDSGQETLLLAEPFLSNGTDWQPILSNLMLNLDDGHEFLPYCWKPLGCASRGSALLESCDLRDESGGFRDAEYCGYERPIARGTAEGAEWCRAQYRRHCGRV